MSEGLGRVGGRFCGRPLCAGSGRLCGAEATLCLKREKVLKDS